MTGKNRRPQAPVVTQAALQRAKRALQQDGTPFAGYRVWPDGRVDVLAGNSQVAPPPPVDDVDTQIAAWKKQHGYG